MRGLYIHIPFCVKKCSYCDFYSLPGRLGCLDAYIQAVLQESQKYAGMDFQTLYIGGGTPSLLGAKHLNLLIAGLRKPFDLTVISEATIEANPDSATPEFLEAALKAGINRISFGVQSLSDAELQSVGRIHNSSQAITAIKLAKTVGFKNISADLMIGLPGQTWTSLKQSIETLMSLNLQHISVYCLSLEEGTPLANNPPPQLPSDDAQAGLYEKTRDLLKQAGYIHYEISNFARQGYECQHNLNYWRGGEYLGLGPAAASHIEGKRFKNDENLDGYVASLATQIESIEQLDIIHKATEEVMLRLRLLEEGVNPAELIEKYGVDNTRDIIRRLNEMVSAGELKLNASYRLHPLYVLTSNSVLSKLF